jgi:hypothetical protein
MAHPVTTRREFLIAAGGVAATLATVSLAPAFALEPAPAQTPGVAPDPFAEDELPLQGFAGACSSARPRRSGR